MNFPPGFSDPGAGAPDARERNRPLSGGDTLRPQTAEELAEIVAIAAAEKRPLEVIGAGSKFGLGRPVQTAYTLELSGLAGIVSYEPEELVLVARAGTPLAVIEEALREHRQQLAFEPADYGPLYGGALGRGTIGGVVAGNLSGPRRIKAGAARDHFLGFTAVNGRGEVFKSGARVVKNVTGYDLAKLMAGSHGTLAVLTEVILKVLPAPPETRTLLLIGLDDETAIRAMSAALGSAHDVSGAAHLPAALAAGWPGHLVGGHGGAVTALRLEGPGPSVSYRAAVLLRELKVFGARHGELDGRNSLLFWRTIRDVAPFTLDAEDASSPYVWRISVPPAAGAAVVAAIAARLPLTYFYDWGGGLIWATVPPRVPNAGAGTVRAELAQLGGHATLMRAPDDMRLTVPVFQPQPEPLAALSRRVKESFDPQRILNPGRMAAGL
jgi:glycolate oxidase FAD binding subunit